MSSAVTVPAVDARDVHQRAQARTRRARERRQPGAHEAAILVGSGAMSQTVPSAATSRYASSSNGFAASCSAAARWNASPAVASSDKPPALRVVQLRVHERVRVRQLGRDGVVVEDDHVHADLARARDLVDRLRAAVRRHSSVAPSWRSRSIAGMFRP